MEIAGSIALSTLMTLLSSERPVFHSEADFQHHFAWKAHELDPCLKVRLETLPEPGMRLDLLFSRPDLGTETAIELKYLTREWSGVFDGEAFALKNQGAQDIRAYDVIKDIGRIERFVDARPGRNGFVIALTNDAAYWRQKTHGRPTNADAFRIHEGAVVSGWRQWGPNTGGTKLGRDDLELRGSYKMAWRDFAQVPGASGQFRALTVHVSNSGS